MNYELRNIKQICFFALLLLLLPSSFVFAKSSHIKGYEHAKGKTISVSQSLGWPTKVSSDQYLNAAIQSFRGMTVVMMKPYNPWWHFWGSLPDTTTVSISGFPANADLHVYTDGYREHEVKKTDAGGNLSVSFPSKVGYDAIIKEKPSTYTITNSASGGDCAAIGTWNVPSATCKLIQDVVSTINISSNNVTLDGQGHSVSNLAGDGIFTKESNVVIKNVIVQNSLRGIVYHDGLLTIADGGTVENVTMSNNATNFTDEGVSSVRVINSTIDGGNLGVYLFDQFDGFPTNNISITQVNFTGNTTDIFNDGTTFSLSNTTDRGNYWEKFSKCVQDSANPSQCTQVYVSDSGIADAFPWACKNGWNVTCPVKPKPTPTGSVTPKPTGTNIPGANAIIENARSILGAPYQWGGKGFDFGIFKFIDSSKIKTDGYRFYDTDIGTTRLGPGIDCSGLSMWSYDKDKYGDQKVDWQKCTKGKECLIAYEGAQGQHDSNTTRITKDQLQPGDLLFIDTPFHGKGIDHMALYTGESTNNVIHASGYVDSVTYANYEPATNELVTKNASGVIQRLKVDSFGRVIAPKIELIAIVFSPVSMVITDPNGFTSSKDSPWDGPMEYQVHDVEGIGELNDIMLTGTRKLGNYKFNIVPKPGALSTDTFSLVVSAWINGTWVDVELAKDVKVSDIPKEGYTIHSTEDGITKIPTVDTSKNAICHSPPGNPGNAHTLYLPASAILAHMAHGDKKGKCDFDKKDDKDDDDKKVKEEKKENKKDNKNKK